MSTQYKSLYRSRSNRMVGGVCAGLGEYFSLDPTLVRLGFVVGSLLGWAGPIVIGYVVMMVVVPEAPQELSSSPATDVEPTEAV